MAHRPRKQRNQFPECGHKGFGKFCHTCRNEKLGRNMKPRVKASAGGGAAGGKTEEKRYRQKAKCPYCGSSRVRKNDLNVMSALDAYEYTCHEFTCGKSFNSDQVKEYDQVEVKPRRPR